MTRGQATLTGFGAIALWALLALLTAATGRVPPFQLAAMTFAIGGLTGIGLLLSRGGDLRALRQPARVWALGVGGLFGYHFLYFSALRAAPPVEASLICFLWPLLIVLGATLGSGERLRAHHLAGALTGFAGAALLVTGGRGFDLAAEHARGYGLALAAAFVWASYSILSRRVSQVPSSAVAGFCLVTAALAAIAHLAFEDTIWPETGAAWAAVAGLGLGPVGIAFYLWDAGVKRGDLAVLGAASYAAPLLSTFLLIGAGLAPLTPVVILAALMITFGAALASLGMLRGDA